MPELPEVETFAQKLNSWVSKPHVITSVEVLRGERYLPGDQRIAIVGRILNSIKRRGKFLIFELDRGLIVCHNAMSGFWDSSQETWTFDYVEGKRRSDERDVRVKIHLTADESRLTLNFHDSRLFGSLEFYDAASWQHVLKLIKLGPEPLLTTSLVESAPLITSHQAEKIFYRERRCVKDLLLDQSKIAGIGNIYSVEACHVAGIDPRRKGETLSKEEVGTLFLAIESIIRLALDRNLDYSMLNVYRRSLCGTCSTSICNEEIKGRSTFFCSNCQK